MADETSEVTTLDEAHPDPEEAKRERLKRKIEAGEKRNQERTFADTAKDAAQTATEFAKAHPLAVVAGAVGVGLLIGAMTRPGRRLARRGGALTALATEAALAYGLDAFERAGTAASAATRAGSDRLEDLGDSLGSATRKARREAAYHADAAGDAVRSASRHASRKTSRTIRDLRSRLTR